MKARRASVRLLYDTVNISKDIAPFVKSLTFSDKIHPRVGGVLRGGVLKVILGIGPSPRRRGSVILLYKY